jgi:HSP20 family molecular chaperone IbpA
MTALGEPTTPWLRDINRFMDRETRGGRFAPPADDGSVKRVERGFGAFERTLRVTDELDPDRIDAAMQDGVLTLRLPKSEARKPRRIEVQAGERGST